MAINTMKQDEQYLRSSTIVDLHIKYLDRGWERL